MGFKGSYTNPVRRVAESLNAVAASIKIIELPGLSEKNDVTDFIESFDDKDEAAERLSILIDSTPIYKPPGQSVYEGVILTTQEFCKLENAPRQLYLHPWLKEDSINLLSGSRGVGKTFAALGTLDAVSKGAAFGPWECQNSVPCLFLDGEMTVSDNQERIKLLKLNTDRKSPLFSTLMHTPADLDCQERI